MHKPSIIERDGKYFCNKRLKLEAGQRGTYPCPFSDFSLLKVIMHVVTEHGKPAPHRKQAKRILGELSKPNAIQQADIRQAISEAKLFGKKRLTSNPFESIK